MNFCIFLTQLRHVGEKDQKQTGGERDKKRRRDDETAGAGDGAAAKGAERNEIEERQLPAPAAPAVRAAGTDPALQKDKHDI